jgi:ATP-dependent DNA helicase HFM1/MER3
MSNQSNMSKRRTDTAGPTRKLSATSEDFGDCDLDDDALMGASFQNLDFDHIENYADPIDTVTRKNTAKNKWNEDEFIGNKKNITGPLAATPGDNDQEPVQLANGKWACNHPCKDRLACKHLCCKDGMEKPPKKKAAAKRVSSGEDRPEPTQKVLVSKRKETQTKLQLPSSKRKASAPIEELDLTRQEKKQKVNYGINGPRHYRGLHQLHETIQGKELPSSLYSVMYKKPAYCYSQRGEHSLDFMGHSTAEPPPTSSDYGDVPLDEPSAYFDDPQQRHVLNDSLDHMQEPEDYIDFETTAPAISYGSDTFGDDNSLVEDAMIGLADSQNLQELRESDFVTVQPLREVLDDGDGICYGEDNNHKDVSLPACNDREYSALPEPPNLTHYDEPRELLIKKSRSLFVGSTSSPQAELTSFIPTKTLADNLAMLNLQQRTATPHHPHPTTDEQLAYAKDDIADMLCVFGDEPARDPPVEEKPVSEAFDGLEPWLFREFGDIVELVDE